MTPAAQSLSDALRSIAVDVEGASAAGRYLGRRPSAILREAADLLASRDGHAIDKDAGFPNLHAILAGTVSGRSTEWPLIRIELRALVMAAYKMLLELPSGEPRYLDPDTQRFVGKLRSLMQQPPEEVGDSEAIVAWEIANGFREGHATFTNQEPKA